MNTEKVLRNSSVSVLAQVVKMLLQFVGRRIFITYLSIELLGYTSLFTNIFTVLSVAELGIGTIISFHLYKELNDNNEDEIAKLMYLYKWLYRIVAVIIAVAGGVCYFLLPTLIHNPQQDWPFIYLIYTLQLLGTLLGYLLSYRRTIFIADQKEYYCIQIDLYVQIAVQFLQILILILFRNFILYTAVQVFSGVAANLIIFRRSRRDYPALARKAVIRREDIRGRNIVSDIKNFLVHRVAYAVYSGTDNIVLSMFLGIQIVALYSNYFILQAAVMQILFYRLLNPVQASIGNIVYGKTTREQQWEQFQTLDVFSFFFATYIGIGFLIFFQPAIALWLGEGYLLPFSFVIAYSATIYVGAVFEIVYKYRSVFGDYAQDRNCMVLSAILNVVISVGLAKPLGVTGVQIGTLIALLPIVYGRMRFVVKRYFLQSLTQYIRKHILLFLAALLEAALVYFLTARLDMSAAGIALRFLAWAAVPLAANWLIFHKSPYYHKLMEYFVRILHIVLRKFKGRNRKGP